MRMRRLWVGMAVVVGVTALVWLRPGVRHAQAQAQTADPVYAADTATAAGGNEDEAAARYRASQPRHWRQVMIGSTR